MAEYTRLWCQVIDGMRQGEMPAIRGSIQNMLELRASKPGMIDHGLTRLPAYAQFFRIYQHNEDFYQDVLSLIPGDLLNNISNFNSEQNPLLVAIQNNSAAQVREVLERKQQTEDAINLVARVGRQFTDCTLHLAILQGNSEILQELLSKVPHQKSSLLFDVYRGQLAISLATHKTDRVLSLLKVIEKCVGVGWDIEYMILMVVLLTVQRQESALITYMMNSEIYQDRFLLCIVVMFTNETAIEKEHYCDLFTMLVKKLQPNEFLSLITREIDCANEDLIGPAKVSVLYTAISSNNLPCMKAMLDVCNVQKNSFTEGDQDFLMSSITKYRSYLSREMFDLCDQYLHFLVYCITNNPSAKLKMHGMICYNGGPFRDGGEQEAANMRIGLSQIGVNLADDLKNWSVNRLKRRLKDFCIQVKQDSSLVIVCIMSHGHKGTIEGYQEPRAQGGAPEPEHQRNQDTCSINEILYILEKELLDTVPKLVIVQACQGGGAGQNRDTGALEAGQEDVQPLGREYDHVEMRYPHLALLMSTVYGATAYRKHFITALAAELTHMENEREIYQIFLKVTNRMEQHSIKEYKEQNPEIRSTCKKQMILPAPI